MLKLYVNKQNVVDEGNVGGGQPAGQGLEEPEEQEGVGGTLLGNKDDQRMSGTEERAAWTVG